LVADGDAGGEGIVKEAAGFLLRLACWYGALLILWLPLGYGYRNALVGVGNGFARILALAGSVSFRGFAKGELGETHSRADVGVLVHDTTWRDAKGRNQHVLAKRITTFYQPYSATAFLLALLGASRAAPRRRLIGGALALVALHLAMLACVAVDVGFTFASNGALPCLPRWFGELLAFLHVSVTDWPAGVLIVPLLLWALVFWPTFGFGQRQRENAPPAT
jgi:hypothetical protein